MLLAPAALPTWSIGDGADDRVLRRRDRHRDADARDDERRQQLRVGDPRLGDHRQPRHADRLQRQPGDHQRSLTDPVGQRPGERRHRHERRGPGQQPQAGAQRSVAEPDLEQLGVEEHRGEQRRERQEDRGVAGRERPRCGRSASAASARAPAAPRPRSPRRAATPAARVPSTSALSQPAWLPRTRPHTIAERAAADQGRARGGRARCRGRSSHRSCGARAGSRSARSGTLIQKIHCQARPSTIAPPTSGPLATARPVMALKTRSPRRASRAGTPR